MESESSKMPPPRPLPPSLDQSGLESRNKPKLELIKQSAPQIGLNAQIFPLGI